MTSPENSSDDSLNNHATVYVFVAFRAQRNEVLIVIISLLTSETRVVNLKILTRAADLALPTIAL
jgi:hypothetical protein